MATLGELRADLFPAARALTDLGAKALAVELGWVRTLRSRVPALDALDPGDVVIAPVSTLAGVTRGRGDADALVAAVAAARSAAILVVGLDGPPGPEGAAGPDLAELVAAASRHGLPVLQVVGAEPGSVERSVAGWLVNRRAELEHQAATLERRLEQLALAGGDLAALVGAFGSFLGRAAVLEGRRGDALAIHAPSDPPAAATAASRYLSSRGGVAFRVPLPVAPADPAARPDLAGLDEPRPRGTLALLGDGPASELERVATERVAALLALELARVASVEHARETARRSEALPADGPAWVVLVARQAGRDELENADQREALRAELRMLAPTRRLTLRGDAESLEFRLVAVADAADPLGLEIARRASVLLRRPVAVSRPFGDAGQRAVAEADARATLEAAERYGSPPPVVRADRVAAYRLLGSLPNLPDGPGLSRALLEPLLVGRPAVVAERLATLRAVLDHPGLAAAAGVLGVHRNTVAYRLRRIESLGGWDLQDPELRLPLSIAVRLVQEAQSQARAPAP